MKLLYAHDHKFHVYKDEFYSNGSFSTEALKRYTNVFDEVKFVSRQINVKDKPEKMTLACAESIMVLRN